MSDAVNHPKHYNMYEGIEVIDLVEQMNFNRGNAVKYITRAGFKGGPETEVQDLQKAVFYLRREIQRLTGESMAEAEIEKPEVPKALEELKNDSVQAVKAEISYTEYSTVNEIAVLLKNNLGIPETAIREICALITAATHKYKILRSQGSNGSVQKTT